MFAAPAILNDRRRWHHRKIGGAAAKWLFSRLSRIKGGCVVCLWVGTAITEGTANFLVNRRINESQQMRWSRCGANLLL